MPTRQQIIEAESPKLSVERGGLPPPVTSSVEVTPPPAPAPVAQPQPAKTAKSAAKPASSRSAGVGGIPPEQKALEAQGLIFNAPRPDDVGTPLPPEPLIKGLNDVAATATNTQLRAAESGNAIAGGLYMHGDKATLENQNYTYADLGYTQADIDKLNKRIALDNIRRAAGTYTPAGMPEVNMGGGQYYIPGGLSPREHYAAAANEAQIMAIPNAEKRQAARDNLANRGAEMVKAQASATSAEASKMTAVEMQKRTASIIEENLASAGEKRANAKKLAHDASTAFTKSEQLTIQKNTRILQASAEIAGKITAAQIMQGEDPDPATAIVKAFRALDAADRGDTDALDKILNDTSNAPDPRIAAKIKDAKAQGIPDATIVRDLKAKGLDPAVYGLK